VKSSTGSLITQVADDQEWLCGGKVWQRLVFRILRRRAIGHRALDAAVPIDPTVRGIHMGDITELGNIVAYVELRLADDSTLFGVGICNNIVVASLKAVVPGVNRALKW
jgi:hypothetical protein